MRPTLRAFLPGVLLVVLVAAGQTVQTGEDPKAGKAVNIMWRFDGNGRFPNIHPPSEWRRDKNILWQTPVGIGGHSSPIVARHQVFVTAELGSVVCLDPAKRKILSKKGHFNNESQTTPPRPPTKPLPAASRHH